MIPRNFKPFHTSFNNFYVRCLESRSEFEEELNNIGKIKCFFLKQLNFITTVKIARHYFGEHSNNELLNFQLY